MKIRHDSGWAAEELGDADLGDKRLSRRLIKICDRLSESPESPINQACEDWAETKAAYRFFQNDNVDTKDIMEAHRQKTGKRMGKHKTVLAIQDSSYMIYTSHTKTEGLGRMSLKKGKNVEKIYSMGLMMHSCLAVSTEGLPLGLLDLKIFSRKNRPGKDGGKKGGRHIQDILPIEKKESYRWLESLSEAQKASGQTSIITVCDREADIYGFFRLSDEIGAPVLVRANADRTINKKSRYSEKGAAKLWSHMRSQPVAGSYNVTVRY